VLAAAVVAYLAASAAIGLYAARRVQSAADYAAAGRHLTLPMVVATVFATWYGAETVLGVSAVFVRENLRAVVADPFGASLCLVLVALVFARRLYRLELLTIGDFYRRRYGRGVEVGLTLCMVTGYLGWTAAQVIALGLVLSVVSQGAVSMDTGMVIGTAIVLAYTLAGGMWSVAFTDLFQMAVIVAGLAYVAWIAADLAGGAGHVIAQAYDAGRFVFWPDATAAGVLGFIGAGITLMLGSIPQQDTYQRVMSARNADTAVRGALIGGIAYVVFAFVPMFLAASAVQVDPAMTAQLLRTDSQLVLPMLVMKHMPLAAQVLFFGALLSAIMSSASGALLAPAVSLAENVIRPFAPRLGDRGMLALTRACVAGFAGVVLAFALDAESGIFHLVEGAYTVTLVTGFVPLAAGLFFSRANTTGAALAAIAGLATWLGCAAWAPQAALPPNLAGLLASALGMAVGSLALPGRPRAS
jgi:SSS family solute:Na+ symporter